MFEGGGRHAGLHFNFPPFFSARESQQNLASPTRYRDNLITCSLAEKLCGAVAVFSLRWPSRADAHCALLHKLFNMVSTYTAFVTAKMYFIAHCTSYC